MSESRREFLRRATFALVPVAMTTQDIAPLVRSPQDSMRKWPTQGGAVAADTLAFPAGRPSAPLGPLDNDAGVIALERRLRCACGCTLDVYTCRTTDFSCTYSPRMHAIVVGKVQQGDSPQQIVDWFLAQPESEFGGSKVLMAPPARGFNLMGYLVPGLAVSAVGLGLAAWIARQRASVAAPAALDRAAPPVAADPEKLARLRRALDDIES